MIFTSHASELAIRAAIHLARQPAGKLSPVREIAAGTGLPAPYLAKIMCQLIRAGLVRASRGPGGGVALGQPADSISLASLVCAVEGRATTETCILGLEACSKATPCALHSQWARLREQTHRLLEETSLATLAKAARKRPKLSSMRRFLQPPRPRKARVSVRSKRQKP